MCTDVGHVSDGVRTLCSGADLLVLESNHDEGMLARGPVSAVACGRASRRARGICRTARARSSCATCVHANLAHVVLAHLSENCNDHGARAPDDGRCAAPHALSRRLSVAMQHDVVGPFLPRAARAEAATQYSLML